MMVMWSKYDGSDDTGGEGVTQYMEADKVWKPLPDGGREKIHRIPSPEVLSGDAALMRQAIRAVPFHCKYSSAVLSFERDDVDVDNFNAGDPEARRRVAEVMRAFEDTAYAGIPEEYRPPCFWTTHTHTGRLELNFCAPRAILAGSGRLRSINPHPPGKESRQLFDALRDVFNARYGWADPEDPARARLVSVPSYVLKIAAEAKRSGKEPKLHLAEQVGEWAEAALAAGEIQSRDDLVAQLKRAGIEVARMGKDYITLVNDEGKRIRLRGRIFSATFTSPDVLRPSDGAQLPARLDLNECEMRLNQHQARRQLFHQRRYGGPDWEMPWPDAMADQPDPPPMMPLNVPDPGTPVRHPKQLCHRAIKHPGQMGETPEKPSSGSSWQPQSTGDGEIEASELAEKRRYKARLWVMVFGATLPPELLKALSWIDRDRRTVRLIDGSAVIDHGDRISSTRSTELSVRLMLSEAKAKGWSSIRVSGSNEFQRQVVAEAVREGLKISNPELQSLVSRERATMKEVLYERSNTDGAPTASDPRSPAGGSQRTRTEADRADRQLAFELERSVAHGAALDHRLRQLGRSARPAVIRKLKNRADEVIRFKTDIDLRVIATTLGFTEDTKAGDRNHTVMRHADGTKLIIGVSQAGDWVFSSNAGAKGSVIDLLKWRQGLNLGECRKHLRPWFRDPLHHPQSGVSEVSRSKPQPMRSNTLRAISEWDHANQTTRSVFLERNRGIALEVLASDHFIDTFRVDERQNAVFPYHTRDGLVGTERRNRPPVGSDRSFKAYSTGAAPGIWLSNAKPTDTRLIVVESPIDAMSHWQLLPPEQKATTRYAAIRNGFNDEDLVTVIANLPAGAIVSSACDRDPAGDNYTAKIKSITERNERIYDEDRPPKGDWNEVLQGRITKSFRTVPPGLRPRP